MHVNIRDQKYFELRSVCVAEHNDLLQFAILSFRFEKLKSGISQPRLN